MATSTPTSGPAANAFHGFDESMQRTLGADMRLVYGLAAPILMIVGLVVILALTPAVWLVAAIMVMELAGLAVVIYGLSGMLDEPPEEDAETSPGSSTASGVR